MAVKSIAQIKVDILATIYENTSMQVTAQHEQDRMNDIADSYYNRLENVVLADMGNISDSTGMSLLSFGNSTLTPSLFFNWTNDGGGGSDAQIYSDSDQFYVQNIYGTISLNSIVFDASTSVGVIRMTTAGIASSTRGIQFNSSLMYLYHATMIEFDSAAYNFNTATASRVAVFNGSKNLVASVTTLTELSYVSGVTSSIQAQINAITASGITGTLSTGVMPKASGAHTIVDSYLTEVGAGTKWQSGKGIVNGSGTLVYDPNNGLLYNNTSSKKIDLVNGQLFNVGAILSHDWNLRHLVWTNGSTVQIDYSSAVIAQVATTFSGFVTLNADPTSALHAATKQYVDGLVVGLWDDRGNYNASVNAYPSSGGSGTAGAILKGDIWTVSVAGTLPTSQVVEAGDTVRALVDTPGNTQANWAIAQNNIGYTPVSNVLTSAYIFVGNASNVATGVAMSGDITISNAGVTAIGTAKVLSAMIQSSVSLTTPILGVASGTSVSVTGTGGAGFYSFANQSSVPATPGSALVIYSDNNNRFSLLGTNGYSLTFDSLGNSASRVLTIQNLSGTVALSNNNLSFFSATTSAQLLSIISDATGTGLAVFNTSPIISTMITITKQATVVSPISGSVAQFVGADGNPLRITFDTHNNTSASGTALMFRRSRGTAGTPLALSASDDMGSFNVRGYGATGYGASSTGLMSFKANETFTDSSMGTYATIYTTPDGSVTAAEALRITGAGVVNAINASGKYQINSTDVLSSTTLGSGIVNSSLTSFGSSPSFTGTPSSTSLALSGTGGNGYIRFLTQSSQASYGASGFVLYANSTGAMSWRRQSDTYERSITAVLTADRIYTLPDKSMTFADNADLNTFMANYLPLLSFACTLTATNTAGTYMMVGTGIASGVASATQPAYFYIDSANYTTVNGKVPKLRLTMTLAVNHTAPTGTYTIGLFPLTQPASSGGAGVRSWTIGTVVSGSNAIVYTTPSADTTTQQYSVDFSLPSNGWYAACIVQTGTIAANSFLEFRGYLEIHYV